MMIYRPAYSCHMAWHYSKLLAVILPLLLVACGGGGGGGNAPNAVRPTPQINNPDNTEEELQRANTRLMNQNRELQTSIDGLNTQVANLNTQIDTQRQQSRTLTTDLTRLATEIRRIIGSATPLSSNTDTLARQANEQLANIETRLTALRQQNTQLVANINRQTGGNTDLSGGVTTLIAQNQRLTREKTLLEQQKTSLEEQRNRLNDEKRTLTTQITNLRQENARLMAQLSPTPGNLGTPDPSRPYPYDTSFGTPSNLFSAHAALAANLRIYNRAFSTTALPVATQDTGAHLAWAQGWTGKGVKIGHLDVFRRGSQPFTTFNPGTLGHLSHGEIVRAVYLTVAPEVDYIQFQYNLFCNGGDTNAQQTSAFNYFNENGYHIVNNSYSASRYFGDGCTPALLRNPRLLTDSEWDGIVTTRMNQALFRKYALPAATAGSFNPNMLFVWTAGNDGRVCPGGTGACNRDAAAVLRLRAGADGTMGTSDDVPNAGDRMIYVGSLADGTNTLAEYSDAAGDMLNDYIVAHDDILTANEGSGTSFAAPRVAGAAALIRHKFPNLNGPALKQVLLQTATDLGDAGPDRVYGHGKLNIMDALSPVGKVVAR